MIADAAADYPIGDTWGATVYVANLDKLDVTPFSNDVYVEFYEDRSGWHGETLLRQGIADSITGLGLGASAAFRFRRATTGAAATVDWRAFVP